MATAHDGPSNHCGDSVTLAMIAAQIAAPELSRTLAVGNALGADSESCDLIYRGAIRRAKWLLQEIENPLAENLHAYQLFKVEDGLMSNTEVEQRFAAAGWDIGNAVTIGNRARNLVVAANEMIEKALADYYNRTEGAGDSGDNASHASIRRAMHELITSGQWGTSIQDPKRCAEHLANYFIGLAPRKKFGSIYDDLECAGYVSFIEHVCDMSADEFTGVKPLRNVPLNYERAQSIVSLLTWAATAVEDECNHDQLGKIVNAMPNLLAFQKDPVFWRLSVEQWHTVSPGESKVATLKAEVHHALAEIQKLTFRKPKSKDAKGANPSGEAATATRVEALPVTSAQQAAELLDSLMKTNVAKRFRPFELFLFAAQNGLEAGVLQTQSTKIPPGAVLSRPARNQRSILTHHSAAEWR